MILEQHELDALADAIAERVARRMGQNPMPANVRQLPQFVDREGLERELGHAVKETWIRARVREGMPHRLIAGKMRFRVSEVVPWLEREGHIKKRGVA